MNQIDCCGIDFTYFSLITWPFRYKVHTDKEEAAAAARELEEEEKAREEARNLRPSMDKVSKRVSVDDMVASRLHELEREFSATKILDGVEEEQEASESNLDQIEEVTESQECFEA